MNKILILSRGESDLTKLIVDTCPGACLVDYTEPCLQETEDYDALAILGGNAEDPLSLHIPMRARVEKMRERGKPVFCEYVRAIGDDYTYGIIEEKTHHRLVVGSAGDSTGLLAGDLLDGHWNRCICYAKDSGNTDAILAYHDYVCAHDHKDMTPGEHRKGRRALWMMDGHTMICAFQLSNFQKARLAPRESWGKLITFIVSFLAGEPVQPRFPAPTCAHREQNLRDYGDVRQSVQKGLAWFQNAGILINNGVDGVREGLTHNIRAFDGWQKPAMEVRTDCCGEVGGAFLMDWLLTGNENSKQRFEALEDFCYSQMQVKEGLHKGMIRWSEGYWNICYQDDVARVILPTLLLQNFTEHGSRHFEDAVDACRYLLKMTGKNGLRVSMTDSSRLTEEKMRELRESDSGTTRAHHNGFYAAVLLLCYRAGGPEVFFQTAERGLRTIMELYPNNEREQSETEEMCRLVLPLAILYGITGEAQHKQWLYRVITDLDRVQHPSGAYKEWDTGHRANRARRENDECSLLADNGDPVVDLLYSMNWLPLGFAYAYMVTGDKEIKARWESTAAFLLSCQIHSADPTLDGAWARAFDLERKEIYGMPHDMSWAPCCVESGWTVAEILMGLQFMGLLESGKLATR